MRLVEFVDQPDQTFLRTTQGGLYRSSSIIRWIGSPPKGSRIAGQHSVSSNAAVDAVVLGSLNYYRRFIEVFAIYASVLYELREADFHEIRRMDEAESSTRDANRADDRMCLGDTDPNRNGATREDPNRNNVTGGDPTCTDRSRWEKAMSSLFMLKYKITKTPILKHFDPDRPPVIEFYAGK